MSTTETVDAFLATVDLPEGPVDRTVGLRDTDAPLDSLESLPRLSIGEGEGQLILREALGQGGMGVVALAHEPLLGRDVAVKQLREGAPPSAARALLREARATGSLEHPNIVPVHSLGRDARGPILVMKRLQGTTWRAALEGNEKTPLGRHVEVLVEVCQAVAFAHSRGVVHRDLKPGNVLIGEFGEVTVLDWGVASEIGRPAGPGVVGTPAYMAPELAWPKGSVDPRTDVFLLGACLYRVLAGTPPHQGESVREVVGRAAVYTPTAPPGPPPLVGVCRRAMAPRPEDRFETVEALRDALTRWLRDQGSIALVEAADEHRRRLVELVGEAEPDPIAISEAFASARFGYRQALESWSGNEAARDGLAEVLEHRAAHHLSRDELDGTRVCLAELDALGRETVSLSEELTRVQQRLEERQRMVADLDLSQGAGSRALLLSGIALITVLASIGIALRGVPGVGGFLLLAILVEGGGLAIAWLVRDSLLRTAVSRRLTMSILLAGAILVLHRGVTWALPGTADVEAMLSRDLWMVAVALLAVAPYSPRWVMGVGLLFLVGALATTFVPTIAVAVFSLLSGVLLLVGLGIFALSRARRVSPE